MNQLKTLDIASLQSVAGGAQAGNWNQWAGRAASTAPTTQTAWSQPAAAWGANAGAWAGSQWNR